MTYTATHALGIALLLILFHATGRLVLRAAPAINALERTGLTPMALGLCAWMYWLFALASLGMYGRGMFVASGIVVLIAAGLLVWRRPVFRRPSLMHALAWLPPGLVLAMLFVRTLGPWLGWDDMTAHLTLPKLYLDHGGFMRLPFNVYSNWPSNVQMLFGLALALHDYVLAKLVHLAFLALLTVAIYRFAARSGHAWTGIVAACLLLANDVVLVEAPVANIDIGVAFFFFMAAAMAVEFRESGARAALVLSGVFCGCVAGSKITGLGSIACVFPLIALGSLAHHGERRFSNLARDTFVFAAPAFALAVPWLVKSYVYTGDPLSPVLWKYVGGVEWSDQLADQFWRWQNSIGMGRTPRDYLLLPIRVILQGGAGYDHFAAWISKTWILFLPLTLVVVPFVAVARRMLIPAAIYFVIWAFSSQQTRFLISVLPLLAVATAVAAGWVVDRIARSTAEWTRPVLAGVVIASAVLVLGWASRYLRDGSLVATRNLFVDPPNIREWTPDPVFAFVRRQVPRSAKVLMLNTNHGFFLDHEYVADSFFEASQLKARISAEKDAEGLTRLFDRLGVSYVVADHAPWVQFPPMLWEYLADPAHATVIYRAHSFTVYELARPAS